MKVLLFILLLVSVGTSYAQIKDSILFIKKVIPVPSIGNQEKGLIFQPQINPSFVLAGKTVMDGKVNSKAQFDWDPKYLRSLPFKPHPAATDAWLSTVAAAVLQSMIKTGRAKQ